jgi:hypothetical protein
MMSEILLRATPVKLACSNIMSPHLCMKLNMGTLDGLDIDYLWRLRFNETEFWIILDKWFWPF